MGGVVSDGPTHRQQVDDPLEKMYVIRVAFYCGLCSGRLLTDDELQAIKICFLTRKNERLLKYGLVVKTRKLTRKLRYDKHLHSLFYTTK